MKKVVTRRQSPVASEVHTGVRLGLRSALWREPHAAGARGQKALVRRFALIISMLALASCGFEPLHSQSYRDTLSVDLSSVRVEVLGNSTVVSNRSAIPRRYGELLKAEIEDKANPRNLASQKQFALNISFTETDIALFVNPDGTASRGDLNYSSSYTIKRLSDSKVIATGNILRVSSYNSSPTADFASYVSIEDARKRGIRELAQDYTFRLSALLPTLNAPNGQAIEAKPEGKIPDLQPVRTYETLRPGN